MSTRRHLLLAALASPALARAQAPLATASRLAAVYPVKPSLGYVSALILSAQRRLSPGGALPPASQQALHSWRDAARAAPPHPDWPQRAGYAAFAEAARIDGDVACHKLACDAVRAALADTPRGLRLAGLRPWTDDLFMATLLLGCSLPLLPAPEQARAAEALAGTLQGLAERLQRPDGLFDHAVGSPVAWGRGNGFASLALAHALAGPLQGLPPATVAPLRERLLAHLRALLPLQGEGGLWRQVLDVPDAAPELTVTAMSITALSLAAGQGWVEKAEVGPAIQRGWAGIAARVDADGGFRDVCASTPAGPTVAFYLQRPMLGGLDDRAAAMVMHAALAAQP
ncbi:glycoside hydrolase family 88 protein [Pelomonas sp. Root1444]|uniref:glycoside hydrolase family 88 protein n=1 Tax=Pelomonas sp. Root1444 TaxID=1736464 RepID=UPI00070339B8|nr:glycoside hydrolase family 88 protein [Pelomonas sp. Root1444]KQY81016.1 hypothetical protein ASD35_04020 [Pelomonas sp. Root1444]